MIDVAFSSNKLIQSRFLIVFSNKIIASLSRNEDDFNVIFFDSAPSDMDNHAVTHVFERKFRVYFKTFKS